MDKEPEDERAVIEKIVSTKVDETIHLGWIVKGSNTSIYHMTIEPSQLEASQPTVVTDTASSLLGMNAHGDSIWLHWIDGRFGRGGLMPTNMSKWFSAEFMRSGLLTETLVINTPFDDSEWAISPSFVWSNGAFEVLAWSELVPGRVGDGPIQLAFLDTETLLDFAPPT